MILKKKLTVIGSLKIFVKILEDKLENAKAQFIEESAKFKAEKEKFK